MLVDPSGKLGTRDYGGGFLLTRATFLVGYSSQLVEGSKRTSDLFCISEELAEITGEIFVKLIGVRCGAFVVCSQGSRCWRSGCWAISN